MTSAASGSARHQPTAAFSASPASTATARMPSASVIRPSVTLRTSVPLESAPAGVVAEFELRAGKTASFVLTDPSQHHLCGGSRLRACRPAVLVPFYLLWYHFFMALNIKDPETERLAAEV